MSLTIDNIGNLSTTKLEDAMEAQFGAIVIAETQVTSNFLCKKKRKATLYITYTTVDLQHFIRIIERNGSNVLVIQGTAYIVKSNNLSRVIEEGPYINL